MAPLRVPIAHESDVAMARKAVREVAARAGLGEAATEAVATAVSEVARNILVHAREGEVVIDLVNDARRTGIEVVARDDGPGIADLARALQDGFSTGGGLGLGLPGARRLVDEFSIDSARGRGTTVTLRKWSR